MRERDPWHSQELFSSLERFKGMAQLENFMLNDLRVGVSTLATGRERGVLSYYTPTANMTYRLQVEENMAIDERSYLDLRAVGDIFLGTLFDQERVSYLKPEMIWEHLASVDQKDEFDALDRSLSMAVAILDDKPVTEWDDLVKETLKKRPSGWQDAVAQKMSQLQTILKQDIFRYDLLPRINEHFIEDLEWFNGV